jgi:hypothetical protein
MDTLDKSTIILLNIMVDLEVVMAWEEEDMEEDDYI